MAYRAHFGQAYFVFYMESNKISRVTGVTSKFSEITHYLPVLSDNSAEVQPSRSPVLNEVAVSMKLSKTSG